MTITKTTVQVGLFGFSFSNSNPELRLPLHTYYAEACFCFEAVGEMGLPVVAETQHALKAELLAHIKEPFISKTNEQIARMLFDAFERWGPTKEVRFDLVWIELAVRCVQDHLGHADSFTRYRTTSCR